MRTKKTSGASSTPRQSAGVQEGSDTQGNGAIPSALAAAIAVVETVKSEGAETTTNTAEAAGNGTAPGTETAAPVSGLYIAATALPNIDGRASVLTELPKDLFMAGRQDFAVKQKSKASGIEFATPKDWAMCHPGEGRYKVMLCIKDKKARKLYPITQSLVQAHPKLQLESRPYIVRQAIALDGPWFLWPAPWIGGREFPGDIAHYQAQQDSREDWVQMTWTGTDWDVANTDPMFCYAHPDWDRAEDFEAFLQRGLAPITLWTGEEPFIKRFLGKPR